MDASERGGALPRWTFYVWVSIMVALIGWIGVVQVQEARWSLGDLAFWQGEQVFVLDGMEYTITEDGVCDALYESLNDHAESMERHDLPTTVMALYDDGDAECVSGLAYDLARDTVIYAVVPSDHPILK